MLFTVGSSVQRDMADQVVPPDKQVMLLFAMSKKPDKMTSSMMWASQAQLVDLHDRSDACLCIGTDDLCFVFVNSTRCVRRLVMLCLLSQHVVFVDSACCVCRHIMLCS